MMTSKFLSEANRALNRVDKYQSQVNSTKRLSGIADDPQGTLLALKARNKLSNLELYQSTIKTASSYLKEAESATDTINRLLQSAYEDMITAQGARTPEDLKTLAEDIKNLQDEVLSISKTTLGTSYIFGGYNFTGSIPAGEKKPPFEAEEFTGDLYYNGINLSQISWKDDYGSAAGQMAKLSEELFKIADSYPASDIGGYAKDRAQNAANALNRLVKSGREALHAARKLGVESVPDAGSQTAEEFAASTAYSELEQFLFGYPSTLDPDIHMPGIADIAERLNNEMSKELAGDYILDTNPGIEKNGDGSINYEYYQEKGISVFTLEELDNKFGVSVLTGTVTTDVVSGILTNAVDFLSDNPAALGPNKLTAETLALDTAMTDLFGLDDVISVQIPGESESRMKMQIGTSQTVDVTITGLDLLGVGGDNIYHILGKAVSMLSSGEADPEDISKMITSLQNAQSNVLMIQTKIGATQNRMTLMSGRYDSSELNYTEMRSDAEDVDMAQAIINLTEAQTVYNAALAGGAEILRTSLIDFLR